MFVLGGKWAPDVLLPVQDVAWASVLRQGDHDVPTGGRCYNCAMVAQVGFPSYTWSELVSRAKSQSAFAAEVRQAKARWVARQGKATASPWLPESLYDQITTGYEVEKKLVMVTVSEFEAKYKCKASIFPHLPWQSLIDETGNSVRALLVDHPTEPWRTVRFRTLTGLRLDKTVSSPEEMLRANQSQQLMQQLLKVGNHKCPETGGMSLTKLESMVTSELEKRAEAATSAAACLQADQPPLAAAEGTTANSEGTVVNLVNSTLAPVGLMGVHAVHAQSGQGAPSKKQPGAPRGRKAAASEDQAAGFSQPPPPKRGKHGSAGSDSASVISGRSSCVTLGNSTKAERRTQDQCNKWIAELNVTKALLGHSMKNPVYQAKRLLEQISDQSLSYFIELNDAKTVVESAEKLTALGSLSKATRTELLEHVTGYVEDLPGPFQQMLLLQELRENVVVDEAEVQSWCHMVVPFISKTGAWARSCGPLACFRNNIQREAELF